MEFYDTNSPENWRLLEPDLVIICYDISQRLSLINMQRLVRLKTQSYSPYTLTLEQWLKEVKMAFRRPDRIPILILGLKRDLRSETDPNGIIYPQEAYQAAQSMRVDRYMECSAMTGELVKLAFEDICTTAVKTRSASGGQSEGGCVVM